MNIVVIVNCVPEPATNRVNPVANFFGRTIIPGISSFDKSAIGEGLRLKSQLGDGNVVALTVGHSENKHQLREALSMGCDNAILIEDKEVFDGESMDTSIGSTLSKAIKKLGDFKIVLCGNDMPRDIMESLEMKMSEEFNISKVDSISKIETIGPENITVQSKTEDGYVVLNVPSPALLMVEESVNKPRVPSVKERIRARKKSIPVWQVKELDPPVEPRADDNNYQQRTQQYSAENPAAAPGSYAEERMRPIAEDNPIADDQYEKTEFEDEVRDYEAQLLEEKNKQEKLDVQDQETYEDDNTPEKDKTLSFLGYWGLKEKPFENTGSVRYFYYSPTHKEALVRLIYVIKQQKAGAMLAGGYGTGKTTIAKELLTEIEQNDSYRSVYISNPMVNSTELLQEIAYQLNCDSDNESRLILRRNIAKKLEDMARENKYTVIVVDEAHLISRKDVLEELRLFMNLQYKEKFLTSIILMGQLVLRDVINAMPQFKQRFAMCYMLKPLDEKETQKYVKHRLTVAGTQRDIFTEDALSLIYLSSEGRPRQINNICDMALLIGHMRKADKIDDDLTREIIKDLGEEL